MASEKWKTGRLMMYGAVLGAVFRGLASVAEGVPPGTDGVLIVVGQAIGGAIAVAAMVGIVSGVRNLFVQSKT